MNSPGTPGQKSIGRNAQSVVAVDDTTGQGLLDVLPRAASKRRAVEFVMGEGGYGTGEVVFAGDSGNNLDVLDGPIPAVLVANAAEAIEIDLA